MPSRSRNARKSRKPSSKPRKSKSITFEKRVLQVVTKKAETKIKTNPQLNNSNLITGSGFNTATGMGFAQSDVMLMVNLSQGVGNDQRIGNKISNCKLRISGFVETLPYHATTNTSQVPYELHMLILKRKDGLANAVQYTDLKVYPGSTTGGLVDVISSCYPFNTDAYTIYKHKVFKLSATFPYVSGGLTDVFTGNNPNFWFQRFSVDIPVPKIQHYTDGAIIPNEIDASIIWYVINGDGVNLPANQVRCQATYASYFTFQDL